MLGTIAGDIIGSVHEFTSTKSADFDLFVSGSHTLAACRVLVSAARIVLIAYTYDVSVADARLRFELRHCCSLTRADRQHHPPDPLRPPMSMARDRSDASEVVP
jgi:hypothetical protein